MPLDAGLTTPKQRAAATLASMACPPSLKTSLPILEHRPSSVATAACSALNATSLLCYFKLPNVGCGCDSSNTNNSTAARLVGHHINGANASAIHSQ
ncbi:hypothetical protein AAC387_Pa04g3000 [Persea americana]